MKTFRIVAVLDVNAEAAEAEGCGEVGMRAIVRECQESALRLPGQIMARVRLETIDCECTPGQYREDCKVHGAGLEIVKCKDCGTPHCFDATGTWRAIKPGA